MRNIRIAKKYQLPTQINLKIQKSEDGFYAEFVDQPELWTEAKTLASLIDMVTDAILTYYDVPRKIAKQYNAYYLPKQLIPTENRLMSVTNNLLKRQFFLNTTSFAT